MGPRFSPRVTAALLTLLAMVTSVTGCSGKEPMGYLFGSDAKSAAVDGVFFAAEDALVVRNAPSASAPVIGRLTLHEKVTRSKIQSGYAYVRAARIGLEGWVPNTKLDWRVPGAAASTQNASPPAKTEVEPAPAAAAEPTPEAAAEPDVAPEPTPAPKPASKPSERKGAAVFDAY